MNHLIRLSCLNDRLTHIKKWHFLMQIVLGFIFPSFETSVSEISASTQMKWHSSPCYWGGRVWVVHNSKSQQKNLNLSGSAYPWTDYTVNPDIRSYEVNHGPATYICLQSSKGGGGSVSYMITLWCEIQYKYVQACHVYIKWCCEATHIR